MTSGPGWYESPAGSGTLRWWDGAAWGEQTRSAPGGRPPLGPGWGRLATATQVSLAAYVVVYVLEIVYFVWLARVLGGWAERPRTSDEATADRMFELAIVVTVAEVGMTLLVGVLFLCWLYQAHRSDRMDPAALKHKSGWAIGGWFVPVLNLWRPLQMVNDVRRGALGHDPTSGTALVGAWWAALIVLGIATRVSARLVPDDDASPRETFRVLARSAWFDTGLTVFGIVTAVLAILVVRQVTRLVLDQRGPATGRG